MESRLKRELGVPGVFAMASGAMISSGLFVLPTIVFGFVGPAAFLSYLLAALLLLPSVLSKAELMTAMPKAGGTFFHVDRSMGPAFGTLGGVANWASLAFKCAFALIGLGTFAAYAMPQGLTPLQIKLVACFVGLLFTGLNLMGTKHAGGLQSLMVGAMLLVLAGYVVWGGLHLGRHAGAEAFRPLLPEGINSVLVGAGMVFISFGGVTQVANLAEEVKNPRRDLVRGMFAAYIVVSLLYVLVVFVTVGLLPTDGNWGFAPLSRGAFISAGAGGFLVLSIAALFAYMTTGNAGILTASRTLMAMSQDGLVPARLGRVSRAGVPVNAVLFTSGFMLLSIIALPLDLFVKAASAMLLLLLIFEVLALIVMRESRLPGYRPTWRSPCYPWLHIGGLVAYFFLLVELGSLPLAVAGLILGGAMAWYIYYVKIRVLREYALVHLAGRLAGVDFADHDLDAELTRIVRERDALVDSQFGRVLSECTILELDREMSRTELFDELGSALAPHGQRTPDALAEAFRDREALGSTVVQPGVAIPHVIDDMVSGFHMVVARSRPGVVFKEGEEPVRAIFAVHTAEARREFYLEVLVDLAQMVQTPDFEERWDEATDTAHLRDLLLRLHEQAHQDSP